jgi:hypothetical protein
MMYFMGAHDICFGVAHIIVGIVIYGHADSQLPHSPGDLCPHTLKEPRSWNPHPGPGTGVIFAIDALLVVRLREVMTKLVLLHVKIGSSCCALWSSLIVLRKERSGSISALCHIET